MNSSNCNLLGLKSAGSFFEQKVTSSLINFVGHKLTLIKLFSKFSNSRLDVHVMNDLSHQLIFQSIII